MFTRFSLFILILLLASVVHAEKRVDIGLFSQQDLHGWKQKQFSGLTQYTLKKTLNEFVLEADSRQSASAFYKKIKIDLTQTPILNWSWSKQRSINPGQESEKSGDDFVARLYVIKDGGLFFWKTLSINYVWSYQHSQGDTWNNPFAGNHTKMVSQQDSLSPAETWFHEKRNVRQDFEDLYGKKINQIDGIAIMTDSDNSGLEATAYYGDIYFTAE